MVARQIGFAVLAALGFATAAHALDFDGFRRAAAGYERRMMHKVETVVITGHRIEWNGSETTESNFTEMIKGVRWRRETRSYTTRPSGGIDFRGDMDQRPVRAHPAPPADGDHSAAAVDDNTRKSAPPPPPPPPPETKTPSTPPATKTAPPASAPPVTPPASKSPSTPAPPSSGPQVTPAQTPIPLPPPATKQPPSPTGGGEVVLPPPPLMDSPTIIAPAPYIVQVSDSVITVLFFDGQFLWEEEEDGSVVRITGMEHSDVQRPTIPGHDYWWEFEDDSVVVAGSELKTTRDCWVLDTDDKRLWVDKKDFFLVSLEEQRQMDQEPRRIKCSSFFRIGDDGRTVPGHIDYYRGYRPTKSEDISSITFNDALPDELFMAPISYPPDPQSQAQTPDGKRDGRRKR